MKIGRVGRRAADREGRSFLIVGLVVALAIATACSTTTRKGSGRLGASSQPASGSPGSGAPGSASNPAGGAAGSNSGSGRTGGGSAALGGAGGTGASGGPAPTGAVSGLPPGGRAPITGTTISIGIESDNASTQDAVYGSLGVKGVATGPVDKEYAAVINYINAHGGMAGRKVVPVFDTIDSSAGTFASQAQAICSDFTEDHHVFAALISGNTDYGDLASCLTQHRTVSVWEFVAEFDRLEFEQNAPYVYWPPQFSLSRIGVWIDQLAAAGYFDKGAKVGLLRWNLPEQQRASDQVIKPRLKAHGIDLAAEYALQVNANGSEADVISSYSAQANNAILKFRAAGVDHVLSVSDPALGVLFMAPAESQGYRPRYGLNSLDFPDIAQNNAPAAQLHRAMAVGWSPTRDVEQPQDPGSPQEALCDQILHNAGLTIPGRTAQDRARGACDGLFFLKNALDRASEVSAAGLRAAVDHLGTTYVSPFTFATSFGPGRYDGAAAVRIASYDDGCACFKYTGPVLPAP